MCNSTDTTKDGRAGRYSVQHVTESKESYSKISQLIDIQSNTKWTLFYKSTHYWATPTNNKVHSFDGVLLVVIKENVGFIWLHIVRTGTFAVQSGRLLMMSGVVEGQRVLRGESSIRFAAQSHAPRVVAIDVARCRLETESARVGTGGQVASWRIRSRGHATVALVAGVHIA